MEDHHQLKSSREELLKKAGFNANHSLYQSLFGSKASKTATEPSANEEGPANSR